MLTHEIQIMEKFSLWVFIIRPFLTHLKNEGHAFLALGRLQDILNDKIWKA